MTTATHAIPATDDVSQYRWLILFGLVTAAIMEVLDTTIINVALPQMAGNLGATQTEIAWVSTGYILSNVVVLPMTAFLTEVFGRRRYLTASIIVFAVASFLCGTSHSLVDSLRPNNPETHLAAHGVEFEKFAQATSPDTKIPADLAVLPGTVIGYYGLVEDWMDQELITYLAGRHPEWSFALVGAVRTDVSKLEKLPNVHLLGRKPHAELPAYCKGFAVGLIPHKVNELTRNMNPIKLREYVCAGLPVVSVALPEVARYPEQCRVAQNYAEFEQAICDALAQDSPEARKQRSETMRSETWEYKVARLAEIVARVQAGKTSRPLPSPSKTSA